MFWLRRAVQAGAAAQSSHVSDLEVLMGNIKSPGSSPFRFALAEKCYSCCTSSPISLYHNSFVHFSSEGWCEGGCRRGMQQKGSVPSINAAVFSTTGLTRQQPSACHVTLSDAPVLAGAVYRPIHSASVSSSERADVHTPHFASPSASLGLPEKVAVSKAFPKRGSVWHKKDV